MVSFLEAWCILYLCKGQQEPRKASELRHRQEDPADHKCSLPVPNTQLFSIIDHQDSFDQLAAATPSYF